jgi:hypothetical protein
MSMIGHHQVIHLGNQFLNATIGVLDLREIHQAALASSDDRILE